MWSAWSKPVDMYLGQGLVLVGRGDRAEAARLPVTLSLDRVLQRAGEAAGPLLRAGAALRVRLSGAICPAMRFDVPGGVTAWREIEEVARASIAAQMHLSPADVVVQTDVSHVGLAAALARPFLDEIRHWAKEHQLRLGSVAPLWTEIAGCKRARRVQARGVAISEPDSLTFLFEAPSGIVAATMAAPEEGSLALNRSLAGHGISQKALVKLQFSAERRDRPDGAPRFLNGNWGVQ